MEHTFKPYYNKDSLVLILGSFPSVKSRELGFYYAHPQNRFWKVMSIIFNEEITDKKQFLLNKNIALWDVIESCEINGSSDASIKNVNPNDISLIINNSEVKYIFVLGKKAYDMYYKYIFNKVKMDAILLPSTSPANAFKNLDDLVKEFGVDAVRYYFLHEIPFANDGVFTRDLLIERINGDLANILGNLVQRTISMGNKYFEGRVTNKNEVAELDTQFIDNINTLKDRVTEKMDKLLVADAIGEIFNLLRASNKYIDETTPWILAKDSAKTDRLETVLYHLLESIRVCAVFLEPVMPDTSEKILSQLQTSNKNLHFQENSSYQVGTPSPIFERIDKEKFFK